MVASPSDMISSNSRAAVLALVVACAGVLRPVVANEDCEPTEAVTPAEDIATSLVQASFGLLPRQQTRGGGRSLGLSQNSVAEATAEIPLTSPAVVDIAKRPHEGEAAEVVGFQISLQRLYGVTLSESSYTADLVLTFQWKDPLTQVLLKSANKTKLVLSQDVARDRVWMPDMTVVNRAMEDAQVISTAVTITNDSVVRKVQRVLVVLKNTYDVRDYPYDEQTLKILVSSSRYMTEDLQLVDMGGGTVEPDALKGSSYHLISLNTSVIEETGSGVFHKSRGVLEVTVHRDPGSFDSTLKTAGLLTACSYLVFWMPMTTAFVMPRLSLSVISLLSVMNMRSSYLATLAGVSGTSLGEIFFAACTLSLFVAICINIAVEFVYYELKLPNLAERLHPEVRVWLPILILVNMIQCFRLSRAGWVTTMVAFLLFCCRCYVGVSEARSQEASEERATVFFGTVKEVMERRRSDREPPDESETKTTDLGSDGTERL